MRQGYVPMNAAGVSGHTNRYCEGIATTAVDRSVLSIYEIGVDAMMHGGS